MNIFKAIKQAMNELNNNNITIKTRQYSVFDNGKYIGSVTFSDNNLNVAKLLVSRLNHYTIDTVRLNSYDMSYMFIGTDQYSKPIKLIAARTY